MESGHAAARTGQADTIQATARLIRLAEGTYCIFHAAPPADMRTGGLSGMRISSPPGMTAVQVSTFDADGWIGGRDGAALVRIPARGAAVLVTTYRDTEHARDLPGLQVVRLSGGTGRVAPPVSDPDPAETALPAGDHDGSMTAHIQRRGDVKAPLGAWMGKTGSGQWMEGFAIQPGSAVAVDDLEYQAILGQDWFSPWIGGGEYCGSRGMALPILGLRVRLKGKAASAFTCLVEASFIDGSRVGLAEDAPVMAPTQAPLEAFRIELRPCPSRSVLRPPVPENAAEEALLAALTPATQPVRSSPGQVRRMPAEQSMETSDDLVVEGMSQGKAVAVPVASASPRRRRATRRRKPAGS